MPRLVFSATRKGQGDKDAALENLIFTMSCTQRVATFLGIENSGAKSIPVERDRAGYTKSVINAAGAEVSVTVPAGKSSWIPSSRAKLGKTVTLKTGRVTTKKNNRTLSLTFSSGATVGQISEFLGEIIPVEKIDLTGTIAATNIANQFSIKGGRTYPIMAKAAAETSVSVTVPDTVTEQQTVIAAADKKTSGPGTSP